ncbi:6653_t:CDS:2, partial [Racocetra fulgida]
ATKDNQMVKVIKFYHCWDKTKEGSKTKNEYFYLTNFVTEFPISTAIPSQLDKYGRIESNSKEFEHLYQALKFSNNIEGSKKMEKIRLQSTPEKALDKARIKLKFTQHSRLAEKLLNTGYAILIENTQNSNGSDGRGQNWLGRILMETRSLLRIERGLGKTDGKIEEKLKRHLEGKDYKEYVELENKIINFALSGVDPMLEGLRNSPPAFSIGLSSYNEEKLESSTKERENTLPFVIDAVDSGSVASQSEKKDFISYSSSPPTLSRENKHCSPEPFPLENEAETPPKPIISQTSSSPVPDWLLENTLQKEEGQTEYTLLPLIHKKYSLATANKEELAKTLNDFLASKYESLGKEAQKNLNGHKKLIQRDQNSLLKEVAGEGEKEENKEITELRKKISFLSNQLEYALKPQLQDLKAR